MKNYKHFSGLRISIRKHFRIRFWKLEFSARNIPELHYQIMFTVDFIIHVVYLLKMYISLYNLQTIHVHIMYKRDQFPTEYLMGIIKAEHLLNNHNF